MEHNTKNEGGVITYIGPGCRYDTGEIPAEVDVAGVRALLKRVNAYEATGLEPEEVAKLAQDQQDGLLLKLPCKLGTTVYVVGYDCLDRPAWVTETKFTLSLLGSFGKTLFLTHAEAEAILKSAP